MVRAELEKLAAKGSGGALLARLALCSGGCVECALGTRLPKCQTGFEAPAEAVLSSVAVGEGLRSVERRNHGAMLRREHSHFV